MATDRTAVIGFPVDHSLSPVIHNHWIEELGLDIKPYKKINVDPNKLEEQMYKYANQTEFEKAAYCRDKIKELKRKLIEV